MFVGRHHYYLDRQFGISNQGANCRSITIHCECLSKRIYNAFIFLQKFAFICSGITLSVERDVRFESVKQRFRYELGRSVVFFKATEAECESNGKRKPARAI